MSSWTSSIESRREKGQMYDSTVEVTLITLWPSEENAKGLSYVSDAIDKEIGAMILCYNKYIGSYRDGCYYQELVSRNRD